MKIGQIPIGAVDKVVKLLLLSSSDVDSSFLMWDIRRSFSHKIRNIFLKMDSKSFAVVIVVALLADPSENVIPPETFFSTAEYFVNFLPDGSFKTFSFLFSPGFMASVRDGFISNFETGVDLRLGGTKIILLK